MHCSLVGEKHCIELQVGKSVTALRALSRGHHLYLNPARSTPFTN